MSNATATKNDGSTLSLDEKVAGALDRFVRSVRRHYGSRLIELYMFGSRARNEHRAESDIDVVAVLKGEFAYWTEVFALTDLAYAELVNRGIEIEGRPISEAEWNDPSLHVNPAFVASMQRDALPLIT